MHRPGSLLVMVCALALAACGNGGSSSGDAGDAAVDSDPGDGGTICDPADYLGDVCETSDDCMCDTKCELGVCAPPTACDEVLLSWDGPTEREDGECLRDVAGFRLYVSSDGEMLPTDSTDLGLNSCIDGESVPCGPGDGSVVQIHCAHRVMDLPLGEVFFWVATLDSAGVESTPAGPVSKTLECP